MKARIRDRAQHIGVVCITMPVFYLLEGFLCSLGGSKRPGMTDYARLTWELMWEKLDY
jgi:hypothetical protein